MKLNLLLIAIVLLNSCITKKHCAELNKPITIIKDSIVYKTVRFDTTVYIPNRFVEYRDTLLCDSNGIIKNFKASFKSNGVKGSVKIINNIITATCETDSLKALIQLQQIEIDRYHSKEQTIVITPPHAATWYDKICYVITSLVLLSVGLWVARRFVKPI